MAEGELRIAHTEALFRSVNERIAESAERFSADNAEFGANAPTRPAQSAFPRRSTSTRRCGRRRRTSSSFRVTSSRRWSAS